MSRRLLVIEEQGSIAILRGYRAHGLALAAGIKTTYSGSAGGWMLDAAKLPTLVAYLQYRNIPVEIQQSARGADAPCVPDGTRESFDSRASCDARAQDFARDLDQLDLFGGGAA